MAVKFEGPAGDLLDQDGPSMLGYDSDFVFMETRGVHTQLAYTFVAAQRNFEVSFLTWLRHPRLFFSRFPCSTSKQCRSKRSSAGTRRIRCSYAVSRVAVGGTHPILSAIFHTCVSTGNSALQ